MATVRAARQRAACRRRADARRGRLRRRPAASASAPRRRELLEARADRRERLDAGELPDFLPETREVRESDWPIAPVPSGLRDRRVEITGPDRPEDDDQRAQLRRAHVHGRLRGRELADLGEHGRGPGEPHATRSSARSSSRRRTKAYRLNDEVATLLVRPRGWHLAERHLLRRRRAGLREPVRLRPLPLPQRATAARPRRRPVPLPAEAREPPRGAALERRLLASPRTRSGSTAARSGRPC